MTIAVRFGKSQQSHSKLQSPTLSVLSALDKSFSFSIMAYYN